MKKIYLIFLLIAILVVSGCLKEEPVPEVMDEKPTSVEPDGGIGDTPGDVSQEQPVPGEEGEGVDEMIVEPTEYTIRITDDGFVPDMLTVNTGDTVTWINDMEKESWPASAQHPTHTVYPGSDIEKCKSASPIAIFDACRGLMNGESWSFVFNEMGEWGYHDHINFPGNYGKVIVQ